MSAGESTTETLESARADLASVRRFRLELLDEPGAEPFESAGAQTVVGSHPRAHLQLRDGAVSRFHFEIVIRDGAARIVDLESRNGTFVDGLRIFDAELPPSAVLAAGRTRLRFTLRADHVAVPMSRSERFGAMVGRSRPMRAAFAALRAAAAHDRPLVIEGERGVGKSLAAQAVHDEGPRAALPFVVLDGALDPGASQLVEPGAGTALVRRVDRLDLDQQRTLVAALRQPGPGAPRLVATTEESLGRALNAGRLEADLFDLLSVATVRLPPLRHRRDDIPVLIRHFLDQLDARDHPAAAALCAADSIDELARRVWPGNASSLRRHVERCLAAGVAPPDDSEAGDELPEIDIGERLRDGRQRWIRYYETRYLREVLESAGHNVSRAAEIAGVDRVHMYRLLKRAGIQPRRG